LHLGKRRIPVGDLLARGRQSRLHARHVIAVHGVDVSLHLQHSFRHVAAVDVA
jgi:hypothetical protein